MRPVLRNPALRDVQVGKNLDSRHERRLHLHRRLHDLVERSVQPITYPDFFLIRFNVYVGDALRDRVGEEAVDELDDRRGVDRSLESRKIFVLLFIFDELEVFFEKVTEKVLDLVFRDAVVPLQMLP